MPICFVLLLETKCLPIAMAHWLSWNRMVEPSSVCFKLWSNAWRYKTSWAVELAAMYSASVLLRATVCCFLLPQWMAAPLNVRMKPEIDFLVSLSPAQSESVYPTRFKSPLLTYMMAIFFVVWTYLRILRKTFWMKWNQSFFLKFAKKAFNSVLLLISDWKIHTEYPNKWH